MPDCPVCSFGNPPDAPQCGNCGADLRADARTEPVVPWTPTGQVAAGHSSRPAAPVGSAARTAGGGAPPSATPAATRPSMQSSPVSPGAGKRREATLTLEPSTLEVAPGSSVPATITVHNLGDEVEHFRIEVNGPAGAFATADPPELRMTKGGKGTAVLRFSPARRPEQPAGLQPFQVVARSTVNSEVAPRAQGTVDVGPFAEIHAELTPEVTRGRRPGTQRLELVNGGNQPTAVSVELHDKDDELVFEPRTFDDRLAPGERTERSFTVCGPRPWFGRTQSFPFTAVVEAAGVPQPVRLEGTRRQVPRFPWWVPTVALALVGIAIALFGLLRSDPTVPAVANLDPAAAARELEEEGYTPVPIEKMHDSVEAGRVIGTDPPAGTALERDESVSLLVSQGPCPEGCPVPVPPVTGLLVDRAEEHIREAGLTPERRTEVSDQPVDQVIRSEPAGGTEVGLGAPVALIASSGPAASEASTSEEGEGGETSGPASTPPDTDAATPPATTTAQTTTGGNGQAVRMPPVTGIAATAALKVLGDRSLDGAVEQRARTTNDAPAGTVLDSQPEVGQPVVPGGTIVLVVARPTDVPLLDAVGEATWTVDGQPVDFPLEATAPPAVHLSEEPTSGDDDSPVDVLVTHPAAAGSISGTFPLTDPLIARDHLRALVRIDDATVDLAVRADGKVLEHALGALRPDGYRELDVDLTPAEGSEDVAVTVTSPGTGAGEVRWRDLRIEGRPE